MSNVKVDLYRRRLATALSRADDEQFIQMCWAIDAIQSGRRERAQRFLKFSAEDATVEPGSGRLVYKWAIESLVNELLTTKKARIRDRPAKRLDCRKFGGIVPPFNALRNIENEEYSLFNDPQDVIQEMSRIGFRQFPWQREVFTVPILARPLKIFGGPQAQAHFKSRYGISIPEFMLGGFAIWLQMREVPMILRPAAVPELGLTNELYARVLNIISLPIEEIRSQASELRNKVRQPVAYKPSVLRRYPCISFDKGARTRAPLVNLIMDRITSGLYYDVIGTGGPVPAEIGRQFERYCSELISKSLSGLSCQPETKYTNGIHTPDILIYEGRECRLVAECKAKRMTVAARFGEDPLNQAAAGFDELGKGVFQIWRHFSFVRRGLLPGHELASDAIGVVFTLDPWLQMTRDRYLEILAIGEAKAASDPQILAADRKPIAFCYVRDLEDVLGIATIQSFFAVLKQAASEKFAGHMIRDLHHDVPEEKNAEVRPYAFSDELGVMLPWWKKIEELKAAKRNPKG